MLFRSIPEMEDKGYDKGYATALSAAAGTIGVIIPPSIPFVIYGVATNTSIGDLFKAGILPGIMMGVALCIYNWMVCKKHGWKGNGRRFDFGALGKSFVKAFWAILSPAIILGGIYSGYFTPTEALRHTLGKAHGFFGCIVHNMSEFKRENGLYHCNRKGRLKRNQETL